MISFRVWDWVGVGMVMDAIRMMVRISFFILLISPFFIGSSLDRGNMQGVFLWNLKFYVPLPNLKKETFFKKRSLLT